MEPHCSLKSPVVNTEPGCSTAHKCTVDTTDRQHHIPGEIKVNRQLGHRHTRLIHVFPTEQKGGAANTVRHTDSSAGLILNFRHFRLDGMTCRIR